MQQAAQDIGQTLHIVTWVDDILIPIVARDNQALLERTQHLVAWTNKVIRDHGFITNFAKGKTELMLNLRGPESTAKRREIYLEHQGRLSIPNYGVPQQPSTINVVAKYKHLGVKAAHNASLVTELESRIQQAVQAHRIINRPILRNKRIQVEQRHRLLESLVVSKLLFGSGFWEEVPRTFMLRIDNLITGWQRSIADQPRGPHSTLTDEQFRAKWHLLPLNMRLTRNRLLAAYQIIEASPDLAWQAATRVPEDDTKSWFAALRKSMDWLAKLAPQALPEEHATWEVSQITRWFQQTATYGPNLVRRMTRRWRRQESIMTEVKSGHEEIVKALTTLELPPLRLERKEDALNSTTYHCDQCDAHFNTAQALAIHQWRKHGRLSQERQLMTSTTCMVCQRNYWTTQRLQQHLRYSRRTQGRCFEETQRQRNPVAQPIKVSVPEELQGIHRLPWTQQGTPTPAIEASREEEKAIIEARWEDTGLPTEIPPDCYKRAAAHIRDRCEQWATTENPHADTLLKIILDIGEQTHANQDIGHWVIIHWIRLEGRQWIHQALDGDCTEAAQEVLDALQQAWVHTDLEAHRHRLNSWNPTPIAEKCTTQTVLRAPKLDDGPTLDYYRQHEYLKEYYKIIVPRCKGEAMPILHVQGHRYMMVTHLFSGRRRHGDVHEWLHQLSDSYIGDVQLISLSMDTAVLNQKGNLDTGPALTRLMRAAEAGWIALNMTGPPCETWSAARAIPKPDNAKGRWPRPLRANTAQWGLPQRTHREMKQLAVGSRLFLNSALLETWVAIKGGCSIMEHPTQREAPHPSTWSTAIAKMQQKLPGYVMATIEQWKYGASAVKPTALRGLGFDPKGYHKALIDGADTSRTKPSAQLSGVDDSGKFRTEAAKEYPTELCRALAITLLTEAQRRIGQGAVRSVHLDPNDELLSYVMELAQESNVVDVAATRRPDYQG